MNRALTLMLSLFGMSLFGAIGGFLFYSILIGDKMPATLSELIKEPRFIAGCIFLILTIMSSIPIYTW